MADKLIGHAEQTVETATQGENEAGSPIIPDTSVEEVIIAPCEDDLDEDEDQNDDDCEDLKASLSGIPSRKRGSDGKFVKKEGGTAAQMQQRQKDIHRKQRTRHLALFNRAAKTATAASATFFCLLQFPDGDVHYIGSQELVSNFKDNNPLIQFNESMVETMTMSLLKTIDISKSKKEAIAPSPTKGSKQMDFWPGRFVWKEQRNALDGLIPAVSHEQYIALNNDSIVDLKKRIFTRQKRRDRKQRLEMSTTRGRGLGRARRGRGRVRGGGRERGKSVGKRSDSI